MAAVVSHYSVSLSSKLWYFGVTHELLSSLSHSGPTWADQTPSGGEDLEPAEDPQFGRGGKDSPGDPEPQAFQASSHN